MARFIDDQLIKKYKKVIFTCKSILLYYFRFFTLGVIIGFVLLISWNLFLPKNIILDINTFAIEQLKLLFGVNLIILMPIAVIVFFSSLDQLIKGFQFFIRISLVIVGIFTYLYSNSVNFFANPFKWNFIFESDIILNYIFYFSFYIIIFDILSTFIKPTVKKQFILINLKLNTFSKFFDWEFIKLYLLNKFNYSLVKNNTTINDNPLRNLEEIYSIRENIKDSNLFTSFESNLSRLEDLIINNDVDRMYSKCICLDGPWGSGKTSLINIINRNIKNNANVDLLWIDFYPWNFTDPTELIRDFFDTLNKEVIKKYKVDLEPNLDIYVDLVTPFIESNSFLSSLKNMLFKIPFFAPKNLNNVKHDLCKMLRNIPDKIVIVLDDLDRLGFDEIETVLKLVRQISSFPNILFVLPFDYNRVSDLITNERGQGYRDYLGKIVNNRIKLNQYTYKELESIFIHSVKADAEQGEIDRLKDIFGVYVQAINKNRFEEIRYQESKTDTNIDITLTPTYNFIVDLVSIFYPEITTKDLYNSDNNDSVSKVKDLLGFYQTKYLQGDNLLESEIFEVMSLKAKRDIKSSIENIKGEIDAFTANLGLNPDELANVDAKWESLLKTLDDGSKYEYIINRIKDLKDINLSAPNNTSLYNLNGVSSCINSIVEKVNSYKINFEDNSSYHDDVKNWLIKNLTARIVKELAIKISDYKDTLMDSRKQLVKVTQEVAKTQLVLNK